MTALTRQQIEEAIATSSPIKLSWRNLSWLDLSDLELEKASLHRANLTNANLSGANLSGALQPHFLNSPIKSLEQG